MMKGSRGFWIGLAVILLLVIGGGSAAIMHTAKVQRSGEIIISSGEPALELWRRLAEEQFTLSTLPWHYHSLQQNAATRILAGTYQLEKDEPVREVVQRFIRGDSMPDDIAITYPEGFTVQQMAARTSSRGIGATDEFLNSAQPPEYSDKFPFLRELGAGRNLEGYLFPDTYRILPDDTASDVIRRMLANFDRKVTDELVGEIQAQGRTLDEVITMASIVEREVQTSEDMAKVAGVLWSRVGDGTGLAADATVRYALNKWEEPLTVQDLQIDSPYNTRRYRGLPPGPISNPGLRAILAAIRPEPSEYYYYLSTPDGRTIFSKTLDEHNQNKAKHLP